MEAPTLFMILLGCKPKGRLTEQHDVFFGIGNSLPELVPHLHNFWPEAKSGLHIDAWRTVSSVSGHSIRVVPKGENTGSSASKLFFLNLGGYKSGEFEELHYKVLTVAESQSLAIRNAKQVSFFKHTGIKGAPSHVDEKYGLDVDDAHDISDVLAPVFKDVYALEIASCRDAEDEIHLGYLQLWKIK